MEDGSTGVVDPETIKHRRRHFNPELAEQIRAEHASGISQKALSRKHNTSQGHISLIVNHKIWSTKEST